jgi:hypothetical protein
VTSVRGVGDVATCGTWQASGDMSAGRDEPDVGNARDVASGTSPPFHVYSRDWEWDPARSRTPEKRGDVRDVKEERLSTCPLGPLPSSKSLELSEGH